MAKLNTVTPGLTGIGLGRNPSGVLPIMQRSVFPLRHDDVVLGATGALMAVAYGLRLADVLTNWGFVLALVAIYIGANVAAWARARPRTDGAAVAPASVNDLDWVGVTAPWTAGHLARMDEALALDDLTLDHPTPVGAAASRVAAVTAVRVVDGTTNGDGHGRP